MSEPEVFAVPEEWSKRAHMDAAAYEAAWKRVEADPEGFWRDVTGAEPAQFQRPTIKRHNPKTVRKNVGDDYHGCLIVGVSQSADLYRRIEGWVRAAVKSGPVS